MNPLLKSRLASGALILAFLISNTVILVENMEQQELMGDLFEFDTTDVVGLNELFAASTVEERNAYVKFLFNDLMLAWSGAGLIFAIIRSSFFSRNTKLLLYSTTIPLGVIFDFSEDNIQFNAYLEYELKNVVTSSTLEGAGFFTPVKWICVAINWIFAVATLCVWYRANKNTTSEENIGDGRPVTGDGLHRRPTEKEYRLMVSLSLSSD
jgi:hypothetical protein